MAVVGPKVSIDLDSEVDVMLVCDCFYSYVDHERVRTAVFINSETTPTSLPHIYETLAVKTRALRDCC